MSPNRNVFSSSIKDKIFAIAPCSLTRHVILKKKYRVYFGVQRDVVFNIIILIINKFRNDKYGEKKSVF